MQFYAKRPSDAVRVATAPTGYIPEEPWASANAGLPYGRLAYADRWLLLAGPERDLIDRLSRTCIPLGDRRMTRAVFVGIQTSADYIYHLTRLGPGRYRCDPPSENAQPFDVRIEDALMKPLVSGEEAKRYIEPQTNSYLLFPYALTQDGARLIPEAVMARDYPMAWAYLKRWEADLRARENDKMDNDAGWWAYNYPKNLDKQEISKLIVPRLVLSVICAVDIGGAYYLDNVDVGGIAAAAGISPWFLAGVLNGKVAGFVFRRVSKPFRGDYRSANRQYIEPLPIPNASPGARADIAERAERLQGLHSERRDALSDLGRRFQAVNPRAQPDVWLFPDLPNLATLRADAPAHLDVADRRGWARTHRVADLKARLEGLGRALRPGVSLDATFTRGELCFLIDGVPVIERVFAGDDEGAFVLAQWKVIASTFTFTERNPGGKLADRLRRVALTAPEPLRSQVIALQGQLEATQASIGTAEVEMNRQLYKLYKLTPAEVTLVEQG